MSKRKLRKPEPANPQASSADELATVPTSESRSTSLELAPPRGLKRLINALVAVHFATLIIAWTSNLSPSSLQGELLGWIAPWHVTSGQDYIMLPLELTHARTMESPVLLQYRIAGDADWFTLRLPGVAGLDGHTTAAGETLSELLPASFSMARSRWPNLARLLAWIALEQPGSDILPSFLQQTIAYHAAINGTATVEQMEAVRLFQPHVLTFDEAVIVRRGQGPLIAEQLEGKVLYAADIVRDPGGSPRLVPQDERLRTAAPARPTQARDGALP